MDNKMVQKSFMHAALTVLYIAVVAWVMQNVQKWFPMPDETILAPIAFLLLFVISASVVGSLVLGKPAMMFMSGSKKEAVTLLGYTIGWLAVAFAVVVVILMNK
ncbi:MAG TPA: hypothetical protein VGQ87_02865 [Patescibacteria group bacterium]|jgi:hypothetical protein|nr:hypothetical protein [Patescibacteria group bacterium]